MRVTYGPAERDDNIAAATTKISDDVVVEGLTERDRGTPRWVAASIGNDKSKGVVFGTSRFGSICDIECWPEENIGVRGKNF